MAQSRNVSQIRVLYKTILKLHRGLPLELKALGDQYVKDEFKRHKTAEAQFVPVFVKEWTVRTFFIFHHLWFSVK